MRHRLRRTSTTATLLAAVVLASSLTAGCSGGDAPGRQGDRAARSSAASASRTIALTLDDGTDAVVQITATASGRTDLAITVSEARPQAVTVRLRSASVEPLETPLALDARGVWRGTADLVPGAWDLDLEVALDAADGFVTTPTASTSFTLPLAQEP